MSSPSLIGSWFWNYRYYSWRETKDTVIAADTESASGSKWTDKN